MEQNHSLDTIYYNPADPGSFSSLDALHKRAKELGVKVSRVEVEKFLAEQDAYTLHRQYRKKYKRNPIVVGAIDKQWQADLADMSSLAKQNNGYKFLMTVIDCFSKYAWAIPLKNKSGAEILSGLKTLLKKSAPRKPNRLQTDKGKEFVNSQVQDFLKENAIHHFSSESDQKAAMVERFNRTLKNRMWKYFTANNTYRYIDVLEDLLSAYNHAHHRTIGMAPAAVTVEHEPALWRRMHPNYGQVVADRKIPKEGDAVRLSKVKSVFAKGYVPNWTREIFKVSESADGTRRRVFKVADLTGEPIKGRFYKEEIQKVIQQPDRKFVIEKILKKQKIGRGYRYLIKWQGLSERFNSWVAAKNVDTK